MIAFDDTVYHQFFHTYLGFLTLIFRIFSSDSYSLVSFNLILPILATKKFLLASLI